MKKIFAAVIFCLIIALSACSPDGEANTTQSNDTLIFNTEAAPVKIVSGENNIEVEPFSPLKSSVSPLQWLDIEYGEYLEPFLVYDVNGKEIIGTYSAKDYDTKEELDGRISSGLLPQTLLFQNAENGHSYIVTLTTFTEAENDSETENGSGVKTAKYTFGVRLP